jgi:hypothetical protein
VKQGVAISVTMLAALLAWCCAGSVPPVPTVPVAGVDAEVRNVILTAHNQATAQPRNGQASGDLGMVLQAHPLFQPAMLAYQRAARLEPREFEWRYSLALVLN